MKEKIQAEQPERPVINYAELERQALREKEELCALQRRQWGSQLQGHLTDDDILHPDFHRT